LSNPLPHTFPTLNCGIRTMILRDHNCNELTLSNLLKSCGESIQTLRITGPHLNLNPEAFGRVLRDSTSPNLECLIILQPTYWRPKVSNRNMGGPGTSPGVLDIAFDSPTFLKNLKTLPFYGGQMATGQLFTRLPKSLVKLYWERCRLPAPPPLIKALMSSGQDKGSLPNLIYCSIRRPNGCQSL
jgi:hypothetical protein